MIAFQRFAYEFCVSSAKAMHDEHGVVGGWVCGVTVHVGHCVVSLCIEDIGSGKSFASCVQNWQSTGWWGCVWWCGGQVQMDAALE